MLNIKKTCYSFKNLLSISDYSGAIIEKFYEYIEGENLTKEELENLIVTFKTELIVLSGGEDFSQEIDSEFVKSIGVKR